MLRSFERNEFLQGLRFVNRPYKIKGSELNTFLTALRNEIIQQRNCKFEDETDFSDEQFSAVSPIAKDQFRELFTFCDPVETNSVLRYPTKKTLTFLFKMRQGLSDNFLQVIFNY